MSGLTVTPAHGHAALRDALAANPFLTDRSGTGPVVDVIVPIYNAADDLLVCLRSVARHTNVPFRLVLMDDGSTDPRITELFDGLRGCAAGLIVSDARANRGFVATVNDGFAQSAEADVVILNSDTVVSARWLEKMTAVSRSRPDVATVTPLTNNGTICAVPSPLEDNAIPDGYDVDGFAALIEAASSRLFPEAPTGVGFCMLITRRALREIGSFDAEAFGAGYGEENDFCQRALRAGFVNLIADDTFVYHRGHASFGTRAAELIARNLAAVSARHPSYEADIAAFCRNHPLQRFHAHLSDRIAAGRGAQPAIGLRVLHILHSGGGTEKHARELAAMPDRRVLSYVLRSDGRTLEVDEYYGGRVLRTLRWALPAPIGKYGPLRDGSYRDALTTLVGGLGIDVVHVHHLMYNTLDIADAAVALGVPYVMTLHDYHTICPMYTLLTPDGFPCGACAGARGASADACMAHAGQPPSYLGAYQAQMRRFLAGAARLFAPNPRVRDIFAERYPDLAGGIEIIEHGHAQAAIDPDDGMAIAPASFEGRSDLNVAVIGSVDRHKGSEVLRQLLKRNRQERTLFHLYGNVADATIAQAPLNRIHRIDGTRIVHHGPYQSGTIVETLIADRIHIGLQLAIWPETFSYTISEFAAAGIPVIAGRLGAQGERVDRCRLGWTVDDIRDPSAVLAVLDEVVRNPAIQHDASRRIRRDAALVPIEQSWRRYLHLYGSVAGTRTDRPAANGPGAASWSYTRILAARAAGDAAAHAPGAGTHDVERLEQELNAVRERLRSPRHRIADVVGNAIQKTPFLWQVVRMLTEAVLRRERTRSS